MAKIASIKRGKPSYFMSILGVTLVLFLLGIIGWLIVNANKLGNHFKENVEVKADLLGNLNPKRITVIARTSTMAYKRRTKAVGKIGQELGADYLLEGSVRREESRVRVTVQLIRVRDQSRIWSESFDRFGSGVIQIQDELGNAIARQR